MQNQESFSFLDLIQNRISNPAILTFTWVLIICNWQAVGWFLFEPLKFSLKLKEFSNTGIEVFFWKALGITALVLIFGRLLSNIVDLIRYLWDQGFALVMKTLKLKQYVDMNSYHKAIDEMNQLKDENRVKQTEKDTLISDLSSFKTQTEELKKQLNDHDKAFATELARSEELREKISTLEQTIKNKEASLNELGEELENFKTSNQKIQKSLNRANKSIEENQNELNKLYKTIDGLEVSVSEKDSEIADLESDLVRITDEKTEFENLVTELKKELANLNKTYQANKPKQLIGLPSDDLNHLNQTFENPYLDRAIAHIEGLPTLKESHIDLSNVDKHDITAKPMDGYIKVDNNLDLKNFNPSGIKINPVDNLINQYNNLDLANFNSSGIKVKPVDNIINQFNNLKLKVNEDNSFKIPDTSSSLPDRYKHLDATQERIHREAVASKKEKK